MIFNFKKSKTELNFILNFFSTNVIAYWPPSIPFTVSQIMTIIRLFIMRLSFNEDIHQFITFFQVTQFHIKCVKYDHRWPSILIRSTTTGSSPRSHKVISFFWCFHCFFWQEFSSLYSSYLTSLRRACALNISIYMVLSQHFLKVLFLYIKCFHAKIMRSSNLWLSKDKLNQLSSGDHQLEIDHKIFDKIFIAANIPIIFLKKFMIRSESVHFYLSGILYLSSQLTPHSSG